MNASQLTNALNNLFTNAAMGDSEALQDVSNLFSWMDNGSTDEAAEAHVHHSSTFADAGILTNDEGVQVTLSNPDGSEVTLQLTVTESVWRHW